MPNGCCLVCGQSQFILLIQFQHPVFVHNNSYSSALNCCKKNVESDTMIFTGKINGNTLPNLHIAKKIENASVCISLHCFIVIKCWF